MAYTAQQLITRAWFLSGIVTRNLQDVTGDQITDGLALLNSLLDFKQVETDLLPYFTYNTTYYTVAGQEKYFIQNCAQVQSVTFNFDTVRYAMVYQSPSKYFGSARVDNITTLPFNWTFARENGGGDLYLYFLPDAAYQLKIYGKFYLADVTLTTDLSLTLDSSYIEYLRYALARYMCSEYGIQFNPESERILMSYQRKLMYMSPPDLVVQKMSVLAAGSPLNFGDVNQGRGWRPS
jgi:hypothetical protein